MKKPHVIAQCISFVLLALMLALLVMQFVPFWTEGDGTATISDYIWFPREHKELNNSLKEVFGKDYRINQYLIGPITLLVSAAAGIVFSVLKRGKLNSFLLPLVCGLAGYTTYFTYAPYKLGANWIVHASLSIAVLAVAVIGIAVSLFFIIKSKAKKN
jgi:hypothetical protein